MINAQELRQHVIRPTLHILSLWSQAAENLLMGTAAIESNLGTHLIQVNGPALGIFQIEPATHASIWENYIAYRSAFADLLLGMAGSASVQNGKVDDKQLITNLGYATAIARIIYYSKPEKLPEHNDLTGLSQYYKKHFNTPLGKSTPKKFVQAYNACGCAIS